MKPKKLISKIIERYKRGESIVLVGGNSAGKTWFVQNELMPALVVSGIVVQYFEDCDHTTDIYEETDMAIVDEVETFIDREYLEQKHPEDNPYYNDSYVEKVNGWFGKLKNIKVPVLYIMTRDKDDIEYLQKNMKITD